MFFVLLPALFSQVFGGYHTGLYSPLRLVENYHRLAVTVMIEGFVLAVYLYIRGQFSEHKHATGSPIYDFYHGIERHPRIGFFDLKYFFEGRPGLTAWTCLSFVFLLAQYEKYGSVRPSLVLCSLLHALYNIDALYYEEGMLTMLDIVYDPFGWFVLSSCFLSFSQTSSGCWRLETLPTSRFCTRCRRSI